MLVAGAGKRGRGRLTVQEKMKTYREQHGYSIKVMSRKSGASEVLLRMLESGNVTHPKIAEQVGRAYKLGKEDIYELIPENYRPGEHYDPDRYVEYVPDSKHAIIGKTSQDERDYYGYIADNGRALLKNGRRGVIQ